MGYGFVIMLVIFGVFTMNVDMCMGVCMLMGMDSISMAVFMGMDMGMFMGVLQFNGVFNHKVGADNHHNQGGIELDCRSFT